MNDIINKIRKYYRKENSCLEIILNNYEGIYYYIRLDMNIKKNVCYLRSYNLNLFKKFDKNLINQEVLSIDLASYLWEVTKRYNMVDSFDISTSDLNKVSFIIDLTEDFKLTYVFNQFIPNEVSYLAEMFYALIESLPKRMTPIFNELVAGINHTEMRYLYNKEYKFNITKDNIDLLFDKITIEKGKQYYKENRVRFLEKIGNSYYAVVEGAGHALYTVVIDYDAKKHLIKTNCNCPCEFRCKHMYAALKHIKNEDIFKFYKVRYVEDKNINMFDKLFSNNYYLCIGINNNCLILVLPTGEIRDIVAIDKDNNLLFEVVEDDDNNSLTNHLNKIKKN